MYIRDNYLSELISFKDTDFIKVITGVRRSGKSVLLKQYSNYLYEQGINKQSWNSTSNSEGKRQKLEVNFQFEVKNIKVGSLFPI